MVYHESLEVPASKMKRDIAEILKREGFIRDVEYIEDNKQGIIRVFLKYGRDKQRVISGLKRISKPGLRTYVKSDAVPKVLNGLGIAIISTSEGVVTDKEARAKKIGGEVLAYVW
jgi:small subunit ribosomal protein S8